MVMRWRNGAASCSDLPLAQPFSAVPESARRVHDAGLKVVVASSAKKSELDVYLDIAGIKDLVDVATSSKVAEQSKPAPDIFQVALTKLGSWPPRRSQLGIHPTTLIRLAKPVFPQSVCYAVALPKPISAKPAASPCIQGRARCSRASALLPLARSNVTAQED
jgi:hypothetical protein